MKIVLVIAMASLGLASCGSTDFYGNRDSDTAAQPVAVSAAQPQPVVVAPAPPPDSNSNTAAAPAAVSSAPPQPVVVAQAQPPEAAPAPSSSDVAAPPPATAPAPVAVVETTKLPPNAHCTALAKQRAQDAAYEGEDPDTQESVHERTYAECVAWDLKHAYNH